MLLKNGSRWAPLAFAFLMNQLSNPNTGHAVEAKMAVALANYKG